MAYSLKGDFIECCDCFTICPCWVSDLPDEDHCSGLYLWSFSQGSTIDGLDVSGMKVAAATFHAVRAGGQAMFFIDTGTVPQPRVERKLYSVFSHKDGGADFQALAKLLGVYLGYRSASITSTFNPHEFSVVVRVQGQVIASAAGEEKKPKGRPAPMTLQNTALSDELGIGNGLVTVQDMGDLTLDVAALPGGPLKFRGRSGMRSKFSYEFAGVAPAGLDGDEDDEPDAEPQGMKTEG